MNSNRRSRSAIHQRRQFYTRSPSTNSSQHTSRSDGHPPLERNLSIKEQAAKFFGVVPSTDPEIGEQNDLVWQRKRFKHLNNQYGVKSDVLNHQIGTPARTPAGIDVLGELVSALPTVEEGSTKQLARISRAFSIDQKPTGLEKRESVFEMAVDTIKELVNGTPFHRKIALQTNAGRVSLRSQQILGTGCSFPAPTALLPVIETSFTESDRPTISDDETKQETLKKGLRRYDPTTFALKTAATSFQSMEPGRTPSPSRPDRLDLFKPSFSKVKTVNFDSRQVGEMESENIPLKTMTPVDESMEFFYDNVAPPRRTFPFPVETPGTVTTMNAIVELGLESQQQPARMPKPLAIYPETPKINVPMRLGDKLREKEHAIRLPERITIWERLRRSFVDSFPTARTLARVQSLSAIINSRRSKKPRARRQYSSLPFAGSFIKDSNVDPIVKKQLSDESFDERPFFTYWITTTQILILLLGLFRFGFGTTFSWNYLDVTERSGNVLAPTRSLLHLVVYEQNNIWIGPSYANLVHMGAKYTPCMRYDKKINLQIQLERKKENEDTGCCVSDVGCYQTSDCARRFSQHIKYINDTKYSLQPIRGVCGQDPRYCKNPRSSAPYRWSTNISEWPICLENYENLKSEVHMKCEIQGRPCCIQMHGQCRITTKQYCDFVKGYYHENATLCSQVSCLGDVCGMTPFMKKDNPDQFYRLFTPLFIHAGIIPCIVSVWLQFTYMRKFEIMIGWIRLAIIYLVSGVGGYLPSAIFMPYMPQVGPVPAQMGVLGAMVINVIYNWKFLQNPTLSLTYHLAVAGLIFGFGFFPFIDNFGQIFGFVFGMLLAIPLIPYMGANRKLLVVGLPLIVVSSALVLLFFMFYFVDPDNLIDLSWLTCVPLAPKICDQQSLQLKDWLPI